MKHVKHWRVMQMSEERLEAVKYAWHIDGDISDYHFYWLIEQAERVQELVEDNESLQILSRINRKESMRLHEQNKSYRKTLEFYANEEIYETTSTTPPTNGYQQPIEPVFKTVPIIYYDRGNTARKALEGEE